MRFSQGILCENRTQVFHNESCFPYSEGKGHGCKVGKGICTLLKDDSAFLCCNYMFKVSLSINQLPVGVAAKPICQILSETLTVQNSSAGSIIFGFIFQYHPNFVSFNLLIVFNYFGSTIEVVLELTNQLN